MPIANRASTGSLERGLDILELLVEHGPLRLAELHELMGVSRATAYRIASQLQARGYVEHNSQTHRYALGASAAALGTRSAPAVLITAAEPALVRLNEITQETVNLALFQGGRLVYVRILEGSYSLRMSGAVGEEAPLYATALGKAILSHLPKEQRDPLIGNEPFRKLTDRTVSTYAELDRALAKARDNGYAVDDEEVDPGAICLGAPILSPTGDPIGGLSVSAPSARLRGARIGQFGEMIVAAADDATASYARLADSHNRRA